MQINNNLKQEEVSAIVKEVEEMGGSETDILSCGRTDDIVYYYLLECGREYEASGGACGVSYHTVALRESLS